MALWASEVGATLPLGTGSGEGPQTISNLEWDCISYNIKYLCFRYGKTTFSFTLKSLIVNLLKQMPFLVVEHKYATISRKVEGKWESPNWDRDREWYTKIENEGVKAKAVDSEELATVVKEIKSLSGPYREEIINRERLLCRTQSFFLIFFRS
jgi:hypothetical protein